MWYEPLFDKETGSGLITSRFEAMLESGEYCEFSLDECREMIEEYMYDDHLDSTKVQLALRYARSRHPGEGQLDFAQAQVYVKEGSYLQALQVLDNLERNGFDSGFLCMLRAQVYARMGQFDVAERWITLGLPVVADPTRCLQIVEDMLDVLDKAKVYELGLRLIRQVQPLIPASYAWLKASEAHFCHMAGYHEASVACYNQLLDAQPYYADAWNSLGCVYSVQHKYTQAVDAFDMVLAIESRPDSDVYLNKAKALYALGRDAEAIRMYEAVLTDNPDNVEALCGLGQLCEWAGDWARAEDCYTKAVALDFTRAEAFYGLALVENERGDSAQCLILLEHAAALDPHNDEVWLGVAKMRHQLHQDYQGAEQALQRCLALQPKEEQAWVLMADMLAEQQLLDAAVNVLKESLELIEPSAAIYFRLAAFSYLVNDMLATLRYLQEAFLLDTEGEHDAVFFDVCQGALCHIDIAALYWRYRLDKPMEGELAQYQ